MRPRNIITTTFAASVIRKCALNKSIALCLYFNAPTYFLALDNGRTDQKCLNKQSIGLPIVEDIRSYIAFSE